MTNTSTTGTTVKTIQIAMVMTEAWPGIDGLTQVRGPTMMTMTIVMNITATTTPTDGNDNNDDSDDAVFCGAHFGASYVCNTCRQ